MMSDFTPYVIVPNKKAAWRTPDFNPNAKQKNKYGGLSTQTQAESMQLDQQMQPQQNVVPMSPQTMAPTTGMIQLPNGQFVTPQQYQLLLQKLQNRR
jgi:hypothetical protein